MTGNPEAEKKPYINERGDLVIPFDSPERYHNWKQGSLTVWQILDEINAPAEVRAKFERKA